MNINLIKFFDKHIGNAICLVLGVFRRRNTIKTKKILAIQLWGIGETILTLPALDALRKKYPKSKIDILTTNRVKDVYLCYNKVNHIKILNLSPFSILKFIIKNKYDIVIDFEEYLNISSIISFFVGKCRIGFSHSIRSSLYDKKVYYNDKKHVTQVFLDLVRSLGIKYDTKKLTKLETKKQNKKHIDDLLKQFKIKKTNLLIGITPGVAESSRQRIWPLERFAELADLLIKKYKAKIIFVGAPDEKKLINFVISKMKSKAINAAGLTNIKQSFELISRCKLFISNDTGPMHVAAAQQVKTIGLFGPNLPIRFGPYGPNNIGIYEGQICKYSPCINVHRGDISHCKLKCNICMKKITVKQVLSTCTNLLRK